MIKQERELEVLRGVLLSTGIGEGLTEKCAFRQRPPGGDRGSHGIIWGESVFQAKGTARAEVLR